MRTRWPALFTRAVRWRPASVNAALGDEVGPKEPHAFLGFWCRRRAYVEALKRGEPLGKLGGSLIEQGVRFSGPDKPVLGSRTDKI